MRAKIAWFANVEMTTFWPEPPSPKSNADKFGLAGGRSLRARASWVAWCEAFSFAQRLRQSGVPGQIYAQTVRLLIFMYSNGHSGHRERLHAVELYLLNIF